MEVLRAQPDHDTVDALNHPAVVEVLAGSPDADRLSTEALTLGQALGADAGQLRGLLLTRGMYLAVDGRYAEAVAYLREAARLASQDGDDFAQGRALLNLARVLPRRSRALRHYGGLEYRANESRGDEGSDDGTGGTAMIIQCVVFMPRA